MASSRVAVRRTQGSIVDLSNSSALVTGGASGLGAATARALAAAGAYIVVCDIDGERGRRLAEALHGSFVHCDITRTDDVVAAISEATQHAPLRAVVNCAGIAWIQRTIGRDGSFDSAHDLEAFRRIIEVNVVGTYNVARLAATAMSINDPDAHGQRGAMVLTASIAADEGQIGQAAYAASKGGLVSLTVPLARDLAVVGIRVNTISPGLFDTPIYGEGPASDEFKGRLASSVLFPKRLGHADEFAALVLETLRNDYLNAATIRLDAGVRLGPK